jgi:hypothetical protein
LMCGKMCGVALCNVLSRSKIQSIFAIPRCAHQVLLHMLRRILVAQRGD